MQFFFAAVEKELRGSPGFKATLSKTDRLSDGAPQSAFVVKLLHSLTSSDNH